MKTQNNRYVITGIGYTSQLFQQLQETEVIPEKSLGEIRFHNEDLLFAPAESSLQEIIQRLPSDSKKRKAIENLKDKLQARILLKDMFQNFQFGCFKLDQLPTLQELLGQGTWVLKPRRGFFGVGVEVLTPERDLVEVQERIRLDIQAQEGVFGESVLSTSDMIFESFLGGEEIAVDMFFNASGHPVIVNICCHPMREDRNYFHTLYYSNKDSFSKYSQTLLNLFSELNKKLQVRAFPIHAEFKLDKEKQLIPIEFNPLRFGGFGLGDLSYFAFGFNPIAAFFEDRTINWDQIWGRVGEEEEFGFVLGYVGTGVNPEHWHPDHAAFQQFLGPGLLGYKRMDHCVHPVFCMAYVHLRPGDKQRILNVDYNDFFIKSQGPMDHIEL